MGPATANVHDGNVHSTISGQPLRVAIADDHVLLREGVARLLGDAGIAVVGQAADADGLLALIGRVSPDVAIVDIRMPPTHTNEGLAAAMRIRDEYPETGVLLLSQYVETHYAFRLLDGAAGRIGYLLKGRISDIDGFVDNVRRVGQGGTVVDSSLVARLMNRKPDHGAISNLTERERDVLALMAEGRSNAAISRHLRVSGKTVETHVTNIFNKLNLLPTLDHHRRVLAVLTYLRTLP